MSQPVITVVGGGATAGLLTYNLANLAAAPVVVAVVNPSQSDNFFRGVAYQSVGDLNVPAANMSWSPSAPKALVESGVARRPGPKDFVDRVVWGSALQEAVRDAVQNAVEGFDLQRVSGTATDYRREDRSHVVSIQGLDGHSHELRSDHVVLATGNPLPATLPGTEALGDLYFSNPWFGVQDYFASITQPTNIGVVGIGLSFEDLVKVAAPNPNIHLVGFSRDGRRPTSHLLPGDDPQETAYQASSDFKKFLDRLSVWEPTQKAPELMEVFLLIRQEVKRAEKSGSNWRRVIDALRPISPAYFFSLSVEDKNRWYSLFDALWKVHRHRSPNASILESVGERVQTHKTEGLSFERDGDQVLVRWREQNQSQELHVDRLINATGPDLRLDRTQNKILQVLRQQGVIAPGPLGIGVNVDYDRRLLGADGRPQEGWSVLGPFIGGAFYETNAIPDIRWQALSASFEILHSLNVPTQLTPQQAYEILRLQGITPHPTWLRRLKRRAL